MTTKKYVADTTPTSYQSDFNIDQYIPFNLVRTQLWMHRILHPESTPGVRKIAHISKLESRVILLVAMNNAVNPMQISQLLGLDTALVTRTLVTLTNKDLTFSVKQSKDRRRKSFFLTKRGKSLCDALIPVLQRFNEHLNQVLSKTEVEALNQLLDKLLEGSRSFQE